MSSKEQLFGFEIKPKKKGKENKPSSPVELYDKHTGLPAGGAFTVGHLTDYRFNTESEMIQVYRNIALHTELEYAIDEIVNEAFVFDGFNSPVSINLGDTGLNKSIQDKISAEFRNIQELLSFKHNAYELFRRWYIDGRLYFNVILEEKNVSSGIKELRFIDPLQLKYVKENNPERKKDTGEFLYSEDSSAGYYEYYPLGSSTTSNSGNKGKIRLTEDSVVRVTSGLHDRSRNIVISYLDKCIKPLNNLRSLEDSGVIYYMARAPQKRAFYIDVDGMSKAQAEQYMRETMSRYRNKIDYDPKTGLIRDNRKYQAMLEDYWLPRRDGKNTEIDVIDGGGNLTDMIEMIDYFKKLLYQSLGVPFSRLEPGESFQWGRGADISREEIKFSKFVGRLRHNFTRLFDDLLRIQLSAKGICSVDDWENISQDVKYEFNTEMYYHDQQKLETTEQRLNVLRDVTEYVGEFYSRKWVRENILGQTEEMQKEMDSEITKEKSEEEKEIEDIDLEKDDSEFKGWGDSKDLPDDQLISEDIEDTHLDKNNKYKKKDAFNKEQVLEELEDFINEQDRK